MIRVDGFKQSNNVQILNNRFTSTAGIRVANTTKAKINGNIIVSPVANAIELAGAVTSSEVANNVLFNAAASPPGGIVLDQVFVIAANTGNKIRGDTIDGIQTGIFLFSGSNHDMVIGNTVTNSVSDGVQLVFNTSTNTISSNVSTDNGGHGIEIQSGNGNIVSKNVASNNGLDGIHLSLSTGSSIWETPPNTMPSPGWSLALAAAAT